MLPILITYLDIDECLEKHDNMTMHNCNENAICKDLDGSFLCSCKSGYVGNGVTCVSEYDAIFNSIHIFYMNYVKFT